MKEKNNFIPYRKWDQKYITNGKQGNDQTDVNTPC